MSKSRGLTERVNALVKPEDKEILENYCKTKDLTTSEVVRLLIRSLKTA
jgi:hypothetical protein